MKDVKGTVVKTVKDVKSYWKVPPKGKYMTFKEIGDILEISESRCCQVHAQAIMKLRNILSTNRLGLRKIVE